MVGSNVCLWFCGADYFAFSAGRSGEAFHCESGALEHASHYAFGAIGGEDSSGIEHGEKVVEECLAPHFGLFFGRKGVEIDDVEAGREIVMGEVSLNLKEFEPLRDARGDAPRSAMQCKISVAAVAPNDGRIVEASQHIFAERMALDAGVMNMPMALFSFEHGENAVEPRAEPYLQYARRLHRRVLESHVDKYMLRLGEGTLHRVIVLVEFGHIKRVAAVGCHF